MSYNIAIAIPPIPADDADAWVAIDAIIDEQGEMPATFRVLHDQLTARYPCLCSLSDDEIDDGVWSDGPLWSNFGHRAAVLGVSYSFVDEVLPFVIESSTNMNFAVFDWATNLVYRPGGLRGTRLTVEARTPHVAPTMQQVMAAVDELTPDGGPGFMILEQDNGNYVQCAGGNGVYTVEWREYVGETFQHCVAGVEGQPARHEVDIPTNGFKVTVKENERLALADAKAIFSAFGDGERPIAYNWRDVTSRFV